MDDLSPSIHQTRSDHLLHVNACIDKKIECIDKKIDAISSNFQDKAQSQQSAPDPSISYAGAAGQNSSPVYVNKSVSDPSSQPGPSYAGAVGSSNSPVYVSKSVNITNPNAMRDVVILSPADPNNITGASDVDVVKRAVCEKMKAVPCDIPSSNSKSGNIALRFPNSTSRDDGVKAISEGTFLGDLGYTCRDANKMLPKLTLEEVPSFVLSSVDKTGRTESEIREAEKLALINDLRAKNQSIDELVNSGHTLQVVYLGKISPRNTISVGLKVSPTIRRAIFDSLNGFIFIGGRRITVKDRFFIKQCYHCQLYGHLSTDCPRQQSPPTCLYCMDSHRSSNCPHKTNKSCHSCAKCAASTIQSDVAGHNSHNSSSSTCPVYIRECKRLAQVTDFSSKNVM